MTRALAKTITLAILQSVRNPCGERTLIVYTPGPWGPGVYLLGFKGDQFLEVPSINNVYCPYIPLLIPSV